MWRLKVRQAWQGGNAMWAARRSYVVRPTWYGPSKGLDVHITVIVPPAAVEKCPEGTTRPVHSRVSLRIIPFHRRMWGEEGDLGLWRTWRAQITVRFARQLSALDCFDNNDSADPYT